MLKEGQLLCRSDYEKEKEMLSAISPAPTESGEGAGQGRAGRGMGKGRGCVSRDMSKARSAQGLSASSVLLIEHLSPGC